MRLFLRDSGPCPPFRCSSISAPPNPRHATSRTPSRPAAADALTEAERRADQARYQEVTCRSALNRVKGMPFDWTLNPYRGCTHGCHYCYARRYHVQFELNADDEFASVILVKHELRRRADPRAGPSVVARRVHRRRHRDRLLPADRRALQADARRHRGAPPRAQSHRRHHQGSDGRARSRRAARSLPRVAPCTVCVSVPTVDEEAWRDARARDGAPASAVAGGARARRRRHQCRRADESDRPRLLVVARQDRAHHQGDRRPRRPLRRL